MIAAANRLLPSRLSNNFVLLARESNDEKRKRLPWHFPCVAVTAIEPFYSLNISVSKFFFTSLVCRVDTYTLGCSLVLLARETNEQYPKRRPSWWCVRFHLLTTWIGIFRRWKGPLVPAKIRQKGLSHAWTATARQFNTAKQERNMVPRKWLPKLLWETYLGLKTWGPWYPESGYKGFSVGNIAYKYIGFETIISLKEIIFQFCSVKSFSVDVQKCFWTS